MMVLVVGMGWMGTAEGAGGQSVRCYKQNRGNVAVKRDAERPMSELLGAETTPLQLFDDESVVIQLTDEITYSSGGERQTYDSVKVTRQASV